MAEERDGFTQIREQVEDLGKIALSISDELYSAQEENAYLKIEITNLKNQLKKETAWEMFRRLWKTYGYRFCIELNKERGVFKDLAKEKTKTLIIHLPEGQAIERMSAIERRLADEQERQHNPA